MKLVIFLFFYIIVTRITLDSNREMKVLKANSLYPIKASTSFINFFWNLLWLFMSGFLFIIFIELIG